MFKNPEFIRNTWTELTAKKLAAMPLLLITVYLLAYILDEALPFSFLNIPLMAKSRRAEKCFWFFPGWRRKR